MKLLKELLGLKRFRDFSPNETVRYLRDQLTGKLRFLGHGSHGVALTDGKKAFKFWIFDSAYEDYIKLARKHQDNPFFPKLLSPIRELPRLFKDISEEHPVKYIKLEMLEEVTYDDLKIKIAENFEEEVHAADIFDRWCEVEPAYLQDELAKYYEVSIATFERLTPEFQEMYEFARMLLKELRVSTGVHVHGHTFDISSANVMRRGSQLVFIDPICNRYDLQLSIRVLKLIDLFDDAESFQ
jgi:hypothetical protein